MEIRRSITNYLIGANILIFILMFLFGGFNAYRNPQILLSFGAQYGVLVSNGQWFRIITAMFVHGGFLHILFNMYVLYFFGNIVEKAYGPFKYLTIYIFSGIASGLLTQLFSPDALSVGASGAIFGLIGLLFGSGFREDTPQILKPISGTALLPMILINIFLGFTVSTINNIAHIGGLTAGFTFGWLTPFKATFKSWQLWKALFYISFIIIIVSFIFLIMAIFGL